MERWTGLGTFRLHQKATSLWIGAKKKKKWYSQASHPYVVFIFSWSIFNIAISLESPFIHIVQYSVQLYLILLTIISMEGFVFLNRCFYYYGLPSPIAVHTEVCNEPVCTHLDEERIWLKASVLWLIICVFWDSGEIKWLYFSLQCFTEA